MRRPFALLTLLLALVLASGCGAAASSSEDFQGDERAVADVIEDLQEAAGENEERRICRQLLSADLARAAGDCNRAVAEALDDADNTALTVEDVTISGDTARARVATGNDENTTETFQLVRENRSWRISRFGS